MRCKRSSKGRNSINVDEEMVDAITYTMRWNKTCCRSVVLKFIGFDPHTFDLGSQVTHTFDYISKVAKAVFNFDQR